MEGSIAWARRGAYFPRLRAAGILILVALAVSPPAEAAGAAGAGETGMRELLSNERTLTLWAHPRHRAPIRSSPDPSAEWIAKVHRFTEDGFPEVYLLLRRRIDDEGVAWLRIRVPMRPNGAKGWVHASALRRIHRVRTRLVVDRGDQEATLYRRGEEVWDSPIGVGAAGTPTPSGHFWIRERFKVADSSGPYGPWAFGTSAYSSLSDWPGGGVIGIHGTNQPSLIPGTPSHGCIRVPNHEIERLARRMPIGTPVRIR